MSLTVLPSMSEAPTAQHPTICPPWCKHRTHPAGHHFGPTATWHFSTQYKLPNTDPAYPNDHTLLRVELVRCDEDGAVGETRLVVSGESDQETNAAETDILLVDLQALVDTVRVLRRQMGA